MRIRLGQTLSELEQLRQEAIKKEKQVAELQKTLNELQAELAALKGEPIPPGAEGVPLVGEIPWYNKYWKYLAGGGIVTLVIVGIVVKKRKK